MTDVSKTRTFVPGDHVKFRFHGGRYIFGKVVAEVPAGRNGERVYEKLGMSEKWAVHTSGKSRRETSYLVLANERPVVYWPGVQVVEHVLP